MRSINLQIGLLESSVNPIDVNVKNIDILINCYYLITLWSCTSDAVDLCHLLALSLIIYLRQLESFYLIFYNSGAFGTLFTYFTYKFDTIPEAERPFPFLFSIESRKQYKEFSSCLENLKLTNQKYV